MKIKDFNKLQFLKSKKIIKINRIIHELLKSPFDIFRKVVEVENNRNQRFQLVAIAEIKVKSTES